LATKNVVIAHVATKRISWIDFIWGNLPGIRKKNSPKIIS
jgi:hypothetical protein